jgi:hypothetical protein
MELKDMIIISAWVLILWWPVISIKDSLREVAAESHRIASFLEKIARHADEMSQK